MKNTIRKTLVLFVSSIPFLTVAQNLKYVKLYEEGNFQQAKLLIDKKLAKDSLDLCANYYMSAICEKENTPYFDVDKAYKHLEIAKKTFGRESNKEKFLRFNISYPLFRKKNDSICNSALKLAHKIHTENAYRHYIKYYKRALPIYQKIARDSMQELAYRRLLRQQNIDTLKLYLRQNPQVRRSKDLRQALYLWEFQKAIQKPSAKVYNEYLKRYPQSPYSDSIRVLLDENIFMEKTLSGDWTSYRDYLSQYPQSTYLDVAEDSIYKIFNRTKNLDVRLDIMEYAAQFFGGDHREEMLKKYHDYYLSDGDPISVKNFYDEYDDPIFDSIRPIEVRWAKLADTLQLHKPFDPGLTREYDRYIRNNADKDLAFVAIQRLISLDIEYGRYENALRTISQYEKIFPEKSNNRKWYYDLVFILKSPIQKDIKPIFLGDGINSKGEEYSPVVTANENEIYFCGRYRDDNLGGKKLGGEDIYVSRKNGKSWSKAKVDKGLSLTNENDAPLSISVDGTKLLIFRSGEILQCEKTKDGWSKPTSVFDELNEDQWQSDACYADNGRAILFAKESEENYNTNSEHFYHGSNSHASDIYVVYLDDEGKPVGPVNLGPTINTRYSDRSPFLHYDNKTLYFSSDGHGGLGHRDMFMSTRLCDTCWTQWSEPVNLGKEINSINNDNDYKVNLEGTRAYFYKGNISSKNTDIYSINLPKNARPNPVATYSAKIVNANGNAVDATVTWTIKDSKKVLGTAHPDPITGRLFIALPYGDDYTLTIKSDDYAIVTENISLRNSKNNLSSKEIVLRK